MDSLTNTVNTPFISFCSDLIRYHFFFADSTAAVLTSATTTRGIQVSGYRNENGVYCTVINLEVLLPDVGHFGVKQ